MQASSWKSVRQMDVQTDDAYVGNKKILFVQVNCGKQTDQVQYAPIHLIWWGHKYNITQNA